MGKFFPYLIYLKFSTKFLIKVLFKILMLSKFLASVLTFFVSFLVFKKTNFVELDSNFF